VLAQLWLSEVFTCTLMVPAIMLTIVPLALSPSLIVSQVWPPSREWISEAWLPQARAQRSEVQLSRGPNFARMKTNSLSFLKKSKYRGVLA